MNLRDRRTHRFFRILFIDVADLWARIFGFPGGRHD